MRTYFENVKKNFGFGCMRLPMNGDQVDYEETKKMVDTFLSNGFNYFDTAHGYLGGKSEIALRECLTSRYPRSSYILTNKLSTHHFTKNEEIRPLFESQLQICGVDYFDFYLMHAQDKNIFAKYKECRAYETALEFLAEGKIKHLGISFHDQADVLDQILTEYPQIEVVQIQLNYVDFDDPSVQSRKCLEVCRAHGKPAIIMEPVKGGSLVNLPVEAQKVFDELHGGSNASYAMRYGKDYCTSHYITLDQISEVVLEDIRKQARFAKYCRTGYLQLLLEEQQARDEEELEQQKNNAELAQKRFDQIDTVIRKLLEQNAIGVISDERFAAMMKDYESEQESLKQAIAEYEKAREAHSETVENAEKYIEIIEQYTDLKKLNARILNRLIEKIVVHQRGIDKDGCMFQQIEIYYRFIGKTDIDLYDFLCPAA